MKRAGWLFRGGEVGPGVGGIVSCSACARTDFACS